MMRAMGYSHVSTDEKSRQGVSLSNQEQKIQAYCTAGGWEVVAVIREEGYSGKDLNRLEPNDRLFSRLLYLCIQLIYQYQNFYPKKERL